MRTERRAANTARISREGPPRATDAPPRGQRAKRAWGDVQSRRAAPGRPCERGEAKARRGRPRAWTGGRHADTTHAQVVQGGRDRRAPSGDSERSERGGMFSREGPPRDVSASGAKPRPAGADRERGREADTRT